MTDLDIMKQALEALDSGVDVQMQRVVWTEYDSCLIAEAAAALRERLAQPEQELIKHHGDDEGWSEWVCPDPKGYLMKCCDCGLVHEAQFGVAHYKSDTDREDCDMVDDPNLQAVFRMRRSEQWSPADTAHRAGGSMMEQPAQQEPVAAECKFEGLDTWGRCSLEHHNLVQSEPHKWPDYQTRLLYTSPPPQRTWVGLTDEQIEREWQFLHDEENNPPDHHDFARAIEAAHGIKEQK